MSDPGFTDENALGNAVPQNEAEQQAELDYVESLLAGTNTAEQEQAERDARRMEGEFGL